MIRRRYTNEYLESLIGIKSNGRTIIGYKRERYIYLISECIYHGNQKTVISDYIKRGNTLPKCKECFKEQRCLKEQKYLIGKKYGSLTITNVYIKKSKSGHTKSVAKTKCECGNIKDIYCASILKGVTRSCGCFSCIDLAGKKIGDFIVKEKILNKKATCWKCVCKNCNFTRTYKARILALRNKNNYRQLCNKGDKV